MRRPLTVDDQRAKVATRKLHAAVDGLDKASKITGKSLAMHGFYQSPDKQEIITIADVMRLEAVCRGSENHPQVTRLLCENAGGIFVPLPDVDAGAGDLGRHVLAITDRLGRLARNLSDALEDGVIDQPEVAQMRADVRALTEEVLACDEQLKQLEQLEASAPAPAPSSLREVSTGPP